MRDRSGLPAAMAAPPLLQHARARRMLYQAKDGYSGYEFEARVNFKVHSALNDLDVASELQKGAGQ